MRKMINIKDIEKKIIAYFGEYTLLQKKKDVKDINTKRVVTSVTITLNILCKLK